MGIPTNIKTLLNGNVVAEARRFFNYPFAAIEESLSNAVYHKGYDVREPIEVRVLPDRIEIVSHPGADCSITIEGLKTYRVFNRRYRNRRIGEFLKEMHLTEGRNTGFRKILNALENNGSPKPIFFTDEERLSFTTTIFIHPEFKSKHINGEINGEIKLTDIQVKIIKIIKENPCCTLKEMKEKINVSHNTIERHLKVLRESGYVERVGARKDGHWSVKI